MTIWRGFFHTTQSTAHGRAKQAMRKSDEQAL
jgi:hypothetical protein